MLTAFGAAAVSAMLLSYSLESRSSWFVLSFAVACLASSAYGWLAGAWPPTKSTPWQLQQAR